MKNLWNSRKTLALAAVFLLANSLLANAATIVINASDRGRHRNTGEHPLDGSFVVGKNGVTGFEARNWFVFHIPFISPADTITSAKLRLRVAPVTGFESANPSEAYQLHSVDSHTVAQLTAASAPSDPVGLAIYNDLADGTLFGSRDYSNADKGEQPAITLNASFLSFANANSDTDIAIGGSVATLDGNPATNELLFAFGGSNPSNTQLVIVTAAVPEPSTGILSGVLATFAMAFSRRRRNNKRSSIL